MLNFLTKGISKFFGTKSQRDIREITPYVEQTNVEFAKLAVLTDDQLRQQSAELKTIIAERLRPVDEQIASLRQRIDEEPDMDVNEKESAGGRVTGNPRARVCQY